MPLPKDDMGACISKFKKENPKGRSKKKKGKKALQKQAVAACLNVTEGRPYTFKEFLIEIQRAPETYEYDTINVGDEVHITPTGEIGEVVDEESDWLYVIVDVDGRKKRYHISEVEPAKYKDQPPAIPTKYNT